MMTPYDTSETKEISDLSDTDSDKPRIIKPSQEDAEAAVDVLLRWIGEDPTREGLAGTPGRVVRAWREFCSGYDEDPAQILARTFEEVEGYDDMVMLRNIRLESHCEHHLCQFWALRILPICPIGGLLVFPSWRACLMVLRIVCKPKKP
jgi:GTP cyclohydrolase I